MTNLIEEEKRVKALVVEDNEITQRIMSVFLEKLNVEIVIVENGADAISKLREETCDVIFLDVIMPLLDGYEVCKILKSNPKTKAIPVIMLTSNDGFFDKIRGKKAGADIYLTKPVKYDEIVKSLKKYFPDIKESQS